MKMSYMLAISLLAMPLMVSATGSTTDDKAAVAALDAQFQKAVKENDVKTMASILADDFVVVEGDGKRWTKTDLLESAKNGSTHCVRQEDTDRSVQIWGDTAVVTAKLWAKGIEDGKHVNYVEWFSDTYVRAPSGWSYVFGQASLPLPKTHLQ